jgi:replicative DNA helicase
MENANKSEQYTMMFSLDMHKNMVYQKLAQKLTGYSKEAIMDFYKNRRLDKIQFIKDTIAQHYSKTFFDFSSTLTMEEMRNKVLEVERQSGKKIRLVVVDYAGRVSGPYSDAYANAKYNALKSTEVANVTDAAWLYVCQISRNAGDVFTPLRSKRVAKESGDWEETANVIITMWRPFAGEEHLDDVVRMYLAKNRMGKELERPLWWDGATGTVKDMTDSEWGDYRDENGANRENAEKEILKKRYGR